MDMSFDRADLRLPCAALLKLRDARGLSVVCRAGSVWITLEQDSRDIALVAGESFVIDRDGLTLVEVIVDADLSLSTATVAAPTRSWKALVDRAAAALRGVLSAALPARG